MRTTVSAPHEPLQPDLGRGEQQPHEVIWSLTNAWVTSRCLQLITALGVADQIAEGPVSTEELAARLHVHAEALDRILSLLASHGIFARGSHGYTHTRASRLLRRDDPASMWAFPTMNGLPFALTAYANLDHSLRTGEPAIDTVEPGGLWAYLQDRPDEAQIFAQAMEGKAVGDIAAVRASYDFSNYETIADIGGGRGHLLRAVLNDARSSRGILFDLPDVIHSLHIQEDRLSLKAGDFFTDPLPAADAYVLMEILHDWDDGDCVRILSAIRRSAAPGGKLIVIEDGIAERGKDEAGQNLDVLMLAVTGGRERTTAEFDELFAQTGFSRGTVSDVAGRLRIVEATAI